MANKKGIARIIPTKQNFKTRAKSTGKGLLGGLASGILKTSFGGSPVGGLLGGFVAGAMIKGDEGQTIATIAGMRFMEDTLAGGSSNGNNAGVM